MGISLLLTGYIAESRAHLIVRKGGQPRTALPLLMRVAFDCATASQSTKKPEVAGSEAEMSLKYANPARSDVTSLGSPI